MVKRRLGSSALAAVCLVALAGCTSLDLRTGSGSEETPEPKSPVSLSSNVEDKAADVKVDTVVTAAADHGEVTAVTLQSADGKIKVPGRVTAGRWVAADRLEPGTAYDLSVTGTGEDGADKTRASTFTTQALTLKEQTYPSVAPLKGETVGVGMPVIVTFDVPVKNRALYERNMHVTSSADVDGSWSWFSDREVHFRPKTYWPARTKVNVSLKLNGLPASEGVYGQQDQDIDFSIGRKAVSVVDVGRHTLKFKVDGKTRRTLPVTAGDDGHRTREGVKVIMEKFSSVDMDAATTGVDSEDADYYNISDVRWAMRLTNSGEFLHAAPWSVASQGNANVSHGCTGMSTANAALLYNQSRRGDIVDYRDSPRGLEDRNGWTDWNVPWKDWVKGSALPQAPAPTPTPSASPTPSPATA